MKNLERFSPTVINPNHPLTQAKEIHIPSLQRENSRIPELSGLT